MNEKILAITENGHQFEGWQSTSGYKIITDKQEIMFGISDSQSCCERWGYFMSNDDFSEFIGSELLSVKLVDEVLESTTLDKKQELEISEISCMFINFETSAGLLQFVAYNSHNGYYGHTAFIKSTQLTTSESL